MTPMPINPQPRKLLQLAQAIRSNLGALLVLLALLAIVPRASAQTTNVYYKGGTNTWQGSSWSTNTNGPFAAFTFNAINSAGNVAVFNTPTNQSVNNVVTLTGTVNVYGLVFSNTGTTAIYSSSTTPQTMNLNNGGIVMAANSGAVTIGNTSSNLTLVSSGGQNWTNNSSSMLTVLANITFNNPIYLYGVGNYTISGAMTTGSALYMRGNGTLTMNTAQTTYNNIFEIDNGTVAISNNQSMGVNQVYFNSNAVVQALANLNVTNNYSERGHPPVEQRQRRRLRHSELCE